MPNEIEAELALWRYLLLIVALRFRCLAVMAAWLLSRDVPRGGGGQRRLTDFWLTAAQRANQRESCWYVISSTRGIGCR